MDSSPAAACARCGHRREPAAPPGRCPNCGAPGEPAAHVKTEAQLKTDALAAKFRLAAERAKGNF